MKIIEGNITAPFNLGKGNQLVSNNIHINVNLNFVYNQNQLLIQAKRSEYMNLTKEEKKLYKLTQCNTILNRDMLDKGEMYIKNVQSEYKDLYGNSFSFSSSVNNGKNCLLKLIS